MGRKSRQISDVDSKPCNRVTLMLEQLKLTSTRSKQSYLQVFKVVRKKGLLNITNDL